MSVHNYKRRFKNLFGLLMCSIVAVFSIDAQEMSNVSVIQTDLDNFDNIFTTNYMIYEESEGFNYLGLEYGNLPLIMNDELIASGGDKFVDRDANYYYIIQMDKNNQFVGYTNLYIKGIDEGLNWNLASFGSSIGMTISGKLIYIYGAAGSTDSLFVKNTFVKSIPGNGAFVLTFNEQLELVDEFYYGLDDTARYNDIQVKIDESGDYHIVGRFFSDNSANYSLEIGGEVINPIREEFDNWTMYYVKVDQETKLAESVNSFGGIYNDLVELIDFEINNDEDAFILFDQSDQMVLNGQLLEEIPHFNDVTLLSLNGEELNYYVNYEGSSIQTGHLIKHTEDDHTVEYLRTWGGEFPLLMNGESIYFEAPVNHLIVNRNQEGAISWIQNIEGPIGVSDIFDIALSKDQSTMWVSGTLKMDENFLIDDQVLTISDRFGGFLMALDAETGAFEEILYTSMESDEGILPYTYISQIHAQANGKLKVISRLGYFENELQESYNYTIGKMTIPVGGKGELVIYDLDPSAIVSTSDNLESNNMVYPNPIYPGQLIQFSKETNESFLIYNIAGKEIGELKDQGQFPMIPTGMYWLKGKQSKKVFKITVVR